MPQPPPKSSRHAADASRWSEEEPDSIRGWWPPATAPQPSWSGEVEAVLERHFDLLRQSQGLQALQGPCAQPHLPPPRCSDEALRDYDAPTRGAYYGEAQPQRSEAQPQRNETTSHPP